MNKAIWKRKTWNLSRNILISLSFPCPFLELSICSCIFCWEKRFSRIRISCFHMYLTAHIKTYFLSLESLKHSMFSDYNPFKRTISSWKAFCFHKRRSTWRCYGVVWSQYRKRRATDAHGGARWGGGTHWQGKYGNSEFLECSKFCHWSKQINRHF